MEIRIQFKDSAPGHPNEFAQNELVIRIIPSEAVYITFDTKTPTLNMKVTPITMDFSYKKQFSGLNIPELYQALILEALKGELSNFVRDDEMEVAWEVS